MEKVIFVQPDIRAYRIDFFKALSKYYSLTIVHYGKPLESSQFKNYNIDEKVLPKVSVKGIVLGPPLKRLIKGSDVIIVGFDLHYIQSVLLPYSTRSKVLFWGHSFGQNWLAQRLRKFYFGKASGMITYNDRQTKEIIRETGKAHKVFTGKNTIHIPNSFNSSKSTKEYYLYVGRLQERKGLLILLKTIAKLDSMGIKKKIVIIGDGDEEKAKLQSFTKRVRINTSVEFINGTVDHTLLKGYFSKAIAYVSPGHVGLGVLHSFAYGVPVVTFRDRNHAPEFQDIKHLYNGIITDEANLSDVLAKDVIEFRSLGNNAYNCYNNYATVNHMVNGFRDAIDYVINEKTS